MLEKYLVYMIRRKLLHKMVFYDKDKVLVLPTDIKEVTSEDEYWRVHKKYKRKLKKLSLNLKRFMFYPDEYIDEFEKNMSEMLAYGILNIEQVNEYRLQLYNELNYPSKFRNWIYNKMDSVKGKVNKAIKNNDDN